MFNKNKSIKVKKKKNKTNIFESLKIPIRINYREDKKDNKAVNVDRKFIHLVLKLVLF